MLGGEYHPGSMTYPDLSALSGFPGWQAARPPRAAGPGPEREELRRAYLELLKLALCDLGAASTVSVGKWGDGSVTSRELSGEDLRLRAAGMDWPMQGLTMIGLNRLDDLQACVEAVVGDGVEGDLIEAGAWRGGASMLMRATLDTLGAGRTVHVADSFQGFPEADAQGHLNVTDFLAVPLEEVEANFARFGLDDGVRFVAGFFEETLPRLAGSSWSLIRLDGDTYEATWLALASLYDGLTPGGYVIVDDYRVMPECGRAVDDFRREHGIAEPLEDVDWTCVRWRRESAAPTGAAPPPPAAPAERTTSRPRERAGRPPSERELALLREVERLRARLQTAEQQRARLEASPLAGPRAWLRRRRGTA
jgi:O-methyltransferase